MAYICPLRALLGSGLLRFAGMLSNTYQLPYVPKHQIVLALPASYYAKKQKPVAKPKVDPHGHKLLCEMVDSLNKEQSEQRSDSSSM